MLLKLGLGSRIQPKMSIESVEKCGVIFER